MENESIKMLIIIVFAFVNLIWWLNATSDIKKKKYIMRFGILFLISTLSNLIGILFDNTLFFMIAMLSVPIFVYHLIKLIFWDRFTKRNGT